MDICMKCLSDKKRAKAREEDKNSVLYAKSYAVSDQEHSRNISKRPSVWAVLNGKKPWEPVI